MIDAVIGAIQRDIASAVYDLTTRFIKEPVELITLVDAKIMEWIQAGEITWSKTMIPDDGLIPVVLVRMTRNGTIYRLENGMWKRETSEVLP